MVLSLGPRIDPLVVIDEPTTSSINGDHFVERVVFHPSRGSVVCVKGDTLEELDIDTGALLCHITFDLLVSSNLDVILPAGSCFVVGLLQSRFLVVWDLEEAVLVATSDADKVHGARRVTALATSLCADRWLFFNADGSNNVRVTRVDSPRPAREILRKSALRGGAVVSLAYSTEHHLLSSGCNDGTIQVWSIMSDEVGVGTARKGHEVTEFATPLFAVQLAQSPVVEICIGMCMSCGTNGNLFLAAAYQNRRVDVIAMNGLAHTCVASTTLSPPHTSDFSRLGGTLSLAIHAQLPVLLVHWRSHRPEFGIDVIAAWELVNTGGSLITSPRGGAGGNSSAGGVMTEWWPIASASTLHEHSSEIHQKSRIFATDISLWQNSLAVYASTADRRAIFLLDVQPSQTATNLAEKEPKTLVALSTMTQLTLAQYHDYPSGIPSSQLQLAVKSSIKGTPVLKLQRFCQLSGQLTGSSDQLPDWKSERSVPLVPFQVLASSHQSAICLKLREKGDAAALNGARPSSFSFAVLDLIADTTMTDVVINPEDDDGAIVPNALPAIELNDGPVQHEVRDVCFSMNPTIDDAQAGKYLLLVLSKAGDVVTFQTTRDPSTEQVKLNQPVERIFATPLVLSASYQSVVVCKLLYLLESTRQSQYERLVLSGDDLSVPGTNASSWTCEANERVVDVLWNSSSCPQIGPHDSQQRLLLAVMTTRRVLVLSPELQELRAYDCKSELMGTPESLLWVSQTLVYSTTARQVRYVTPIAHNLQGEASRLLCSIATDCPGFTRSSIQLVSLCGDRLCYAVSQPATLSSRLTLHSVALCEPLVVGFAEPNATLQRVFDREMVAFTLQPDDSDRPVCSITDTVLETAYHTFGWRDKVVKVLNALVNSHEKASASLGAADGAAVVATASSNYSRTSLLSRTIMTSIFLDAHKWEDFIRVFLAHDPALEEYVVGSGSDGAAKLPSRKGPTAQRFKQLAMVFKSIGQLDWAIRCLDLSGDDEALVTMLRKCSAGSTTQVLETLQNSWTKLNPPLSAVTRATISQTQLPFDDLFSSLCCENLTQPMRRGRLLSSITPLDHLKLPVAPSDKPLTQGDDTKDTTRAGTLPWKRLAPEDASEWLGVSIKTRVATTEPRALNYSLFAADASVVGAPLNADAVPGVSAEAANAKMTIGPFQDEEDAVVAYWRFEEGATVAERQSSGDAASSDGLECLDTSKRDNTLRLLGGVVDLVESLAPVDRGEPGRILEEFALHFPSSSASLPSSGWGAQCSIRPGSTLDIATSFDEDPYRRELTFEMWLRNYQMHEQVEKLVANGDEIPATLSAGVRQVLVARRRVDSLEDVNGGDVSGPISWELVVEEDDHLVLTFGNQQVRSTQRMDHASTQGWRHVAFTVEVSSPQRVGLKLFLDARCVGESQTTPITQTVSKPSKLLLGWRLQDYEMTEVRLWATARSAEQLSDMRENYLGLAEAKRRMKIAIHQRNCTCEKCVSRRAQSTANAGAGGTPRLGLPLSTPLAPPSRQRRVVPQAKPTS